MKMEDKELLLKDLCARLPYFENWVQYDGKDYMVTGYGHGRVSLLPSMFSSAVGPCPLVEEVKPYLRPMSSMTEEEKIELSRLCHFTAVSENCETIEHGIRILDEISGDFYAPNIVVDAIDWLNANHFDYRGLIDKGLALETPEGMYKTE